MSDDMNVPSALRWKVGLEITASILLALASVAVIGMTVFDRVHARTNQPPSHRAEPPLPSEPLSIDEAATQGDARARVVLIEFSDFQCPFCAQFVSETLPLIQEKYIRHNEVRFAFRHFPLPIHRFAVKAAEAAECAGRQGRFWQMHDFLFMHQQQLNEGDLRTQGHAMAPDARAFDNCLDGQAADKVKSDSALGRLLSIEGTPAFFLGAAQKDGRIKISVRLSGARPFADFQQAIDKTLALSRLSGSS